MLLDAATGPLTGDVLRDMLMGLVTLFTAVVTPVAVVLGRKAAAYFEEKTRVTITAANREAIDWASTRAITAVDEWAKQQVQKPSSAQKLDLAAKAVRSLAPAAADAVGEALKTVINANVPVVRASLGVTYSHTAASLPPPDKVDTTRLPRPGKLPELKR